MPRITIRFRPTHRYGVPVTTQLVRQQSHPLLARRRAGAADHRRAAVLYRERSLLRADAPGAHGVRHRRAVRGHAREHLPGVSATAPATIGWNGCGGSPSRSTGRTRSSAPRSRSSCAISRRPARSSRRSPPRSRKAPGSGRNWDYRYCWMRDAFFVVRALNRIGATRTMEDFISYILSIAAGRADAMQPLYGIVHTDTLEERTADALAGYSGDGPVRIGNAAVDQDQHDVYGSIIMAATPMFFDRRLPQPGDVALFQVLEPLGEQAARLALEPDAGIWEYRGRKRVHTHSAAMCWAGCQRLEAIAAPSRACRPCAILGQRRRQDRRARCCKQGWNREAQGVLGGFRQRRSRRQLPAAGRTRADRARRSAFRLYRRGDQSVNYGAISTLCGMWLPTISACRRPPF